MGILVAIHLQSPEADAQRAFYEKQLGLPCSEARDGSLRFATAGAALTLHGSGAGEAAAIELWIRAEDLEARVAALKARGAEVKGRVVRTPFGRAVGLRDPEGNALRLVESGAEAAAGTGPLISHAFVNTLDLAASAHFYREVLGLKVANESERWIEFGTGDSCLALHASQDAEGLPLHPDQRVSFALHRDDFDAWTEELRGRGVRFAAAPVEEDLGVIAEVEDADGWCVVLHGPAAFEEGRDDAAFEEDGEDSRGASWSDDEDGPGSPEFGSRKQSRKRRDKLMTRALHAFQRGEGGLAPRGTLPREPREPRS